MDIQLIAFNKKNFNIKTSTLWMINNRILIKKYPDITKNWIRYKVEEPSKFYPKSFRTKNIDNESILIIYADKMK